jgi:hypothetical protein
MAVRLPGQGSLLAPGQAQNIPDRSAATRQKTAAAEKTVFSFIRGFVYIQRLSLSLKICR